MTGKNSTCDFELKLAVVSYCVFKQSKSTFNMNVFLKPLVE